MRFVIILSNIWPLEKRCRTHYADTSPKRTLPFSLEYECSSKHNETVLITFRIASNWNKSKYFCKI